jgi:hypothetical protein
MAKSEPVKRADAASDAGSAPTPEIPPVAKAAAANYPPEDLRIEIAPDPFADLASLRLPQAFAETSGVKKLLTTVPVRKPNPQEFFRVHPDPAYRDNFPMIELKEEREQYLVARQLVPHLVGEFVSVTLFTAMNRQGVLFLMPAPAA